jgi:hypothetical protein
MPEVRFLVQVTLVVLLCHLLTVPPPATALASVHPAPPASNGSCITYERAALLSIKASLRDPNTDFSSWQGEDCCRWKGVKCSYKTGHVVKLNLRGKTGDCLEIYPYSGEISYSLIMFDMPCISYHDHADSFAVVIRCASVGCCSDLLLPG